MAKIIPALWLSLTTVATWGQSAALTQLASGVAAYERKDYHAAIAALKAAQPTLPQLADYVGYYLAAARVELKDGDVAQDLQPVRRLDLPSPFTARSWLVEARGLLTTRPAEALTLLLEHYSVLPQPQGDLTIADAYLAAGDLARAAESYQRVYCNHVSGEAANRAAAALLMLKDRMGPAYPNPPPQLLLRRAAELAGTRDYKRARAEYLSLVSKLTGLDRDQARVRAGAMDYLANRTTAARAYLQALDLGSGPADAERLYYLTECARRTNDDEAMMAAVQRLSRQYPDSPWRLKALVTAANRYLLINRPGDFVPLYQAACEGFPNEPSAGLYRWKVTFQSYFRNAANSAEMLREHLLRYPAHSTAGAALYFLGRRMEQDGRPGTASAYYKRLAQALPNHYYAMLARERLRQPGISGAAVDPEAVQFANALKFSEARPVTAEGTHASALRIERSRLLRSAGLSDLAEAELRFGARTDGQSSLLAMELAQSAPAPHQAIRIMKNLSPDYLRLPLEQAPRRYWDLLFPIPYRNDLEQYARGQGIDTFLLAGLIRQESEFDPRAVSRARAYGLTQIRPATGRQFARRLGISRMATGQLFDPSTNLMIGTSILRSMLDGNHGAIEHTLASYNAGPARSAEWIAWNTYREPAEFVESIPFTETRDYIQAVLRNADVYRRLYQ